jgi:excisionase family DNA binding protein
MGQKDMESCMALITTTEATARLGVNQSRVRQMILAKDLPARKFGRDWMIDEEDLAKVRERNKAGRPKKGKSDGTR